MVGFAIDGRILNQRSGDSSTNRGINALEEDSTRFIVLFTLIKSRIL